MIERQLQRQLDIVAARLRQFRLLRDLTAIMLTCTLVGGVLLCLYYIRDSYFPYSAIAIVILGGAAIAVSLALRWRRPLDYSQIAKLIEQQYPDLDSALITAIEQRPKLPSGEMGYLQRQVVHQAVVHGFCHPWPQIVPSSRLVKARLASVFGLLVLALTVAALHTRREPTPILGAADPIATITHANTQFEFAVEPGDTQVERNTGLLVLARFSNALPPDATLVYETENGDSHRLPMTQSLDDPVFGVRIPSVTKPLKYHVAFADQKSADFDVGVFSFPELARADATLTYPSYTGMKQKVVQDVRHLSAVEGTDLTLSCFLNKSVTAAELVDSDGEVVPLEVDENNKSLYVTQMSLQQSLRWELRLRDAQGRENRYPPKFVINVLPNRPPDLKLAKPTGDVQVSPIEELGVQASAWDDFGLKRVGISLSMPGSTQREVVLGTSLAARQRIPVAHTVLLEDLNAAPDQLLAYHFWAEDSGPDGNLRRVSSDMYFAEVRHFEEIFRQGQQPTSQQQRQQQRQQQQGQGANARQAQQLAELQKQIINGTWNLIRRVSATAASSTFEDDVTLLLESQQSALGQLEQLAQRIEDAESAEHVQEVRQHMQVAARHLETSAKDSATNPLSLALAAEQTAYQALLKLRAREHEVVRSQQQQQSGQGQSNNRQANSRSQQQLQQLELQQDENRYEEQRLAQSQQETQADRENRQVLNRLRELARRQSDLNQRIKELQAELHAVEQQERRAEIERRLKRLRDEQQEIVRDSDELNSRMEQQQNQERMTEQREQLERAREQARRSSDALQEGMVSQAAAAGSRAERELNELRDDFRRRLSTRFDEQMRDMKRDAQQIDERQAELSERLAELDNPQRPSRSLRDSDGRQEIQDGLQVQQDRIGELLEEMSQVVEEAEQTEPLLADELYDTYRQTHQRNLPETLRSTQRSLDRGMDEDAQLQERLARQGIQDLRQGIDRAAENVLGDETEALRRARQELDRLADELDREIADNAPGGNPGVRDRQNKPPQEQDDQRQQNGQSGDRPVRRRDDPSQPTGQPRGQQLGQQQSQQQGQRQSQQPGPQPGRPNQRGGPRRLTDSSRDAASPTQRTSPDGDGNRRLAPMAGGDFLDWSDRLRDVEEMMDDPELRAEAARIRDRAKGIRKDLKRHSKDPNWDLVKLNVLEPLVELQRQVDEELLRRTAKDSLVPVDRDPVPPKYAEQVRLYYERLGRDR